MTVEANVVVREVPSALLVPAAALRGTREARHVFVAAEARARRRDLRTGIEGRSFAEVLEGLAKGEPVLADTPAGMADGARIRPRAP